MKKILLIFTVSIFLSAVIIWFYLQKRPESVQLPDIKTVSMVQMDGIKVDARKLGKERLSGIMRGIEEAAPLSKLTAFNAKMENNYYVLSFIYDNKERDFFYFYLKDDSWYMKTGDGRLYGNAGFITEYTLAGEHLNEESDFYSGVSLGLTKPDKELLQYGIQTEYDMRYWFAAYVKPRQEQGISMEESVWFARNQIESEMRLYQYAVQKGYAVSDDEYHKYLKKILNTAQQQEKYAEVEQSYETAGTTMEEVLDAASQIGKISYTNQKLREQKKNEFRNGTDVINGVTYDSAEEYWNAFCLYEMQPTIADYDFSSLEKDLEKAELSYYDYFIK